MVVQTKSEINGGNVVHVPVSAVGEFSAQRWLSYFENNRIGRESLHFTETLAFSPALRLPLIQSLQRFQIGETGEGNHLRKYARSMRDPVYEQCIDLFIKEEQSHARILAEMIAALDGTLLRWHWSDLVFIGLRRMLHLKTELLILLIAEIVGKCFYLECARKMPNERMSNAFSVIVLDEIAHLEFHCEFLSTQFKSLPEAARYAVYWCWAALFYAACCVFVFDHRQTLVALDTTPRAFLGECSKAFHRAAAKALLIQ
jgi:hypothetical protein